MTSRNPQHNPGLGFGIALVSITTGLVLGGLIMSEQSMAAPAKPSNGGGGLSGVGKGLGLRGGLSAAARPMSASDAILLGLGYPAPVGLGGGLGAAPAKVPNVSGDPAGYNTSMWPNPMAVRKALLTLGYAVAETNSAITSPSDKARVKKFQQEWNKVVRLIARMIAQGEDVVDAEYLRGYLDTDSVPGKQTLNALEIAYNVNEDEGSWRKIVDIYANVDNYKQGPGGKGRIYGKPNLPIPSSFWTSSHFYISPNCDWIIEGSNFLKTNQAREFVDGLWNAELQRPDPNLDKMSVVEELMREVVAEIGESDFPYKGKLPQSAAKCFDKMTPVMRDWRADIHMRIRGWMTYGTE